MNPVIKWPGGKRREIKNILENLPNNFETIVEPFFGGGAFSMHFIDSKIIVGSDIDFDLVNFYKNVNSKTFISRFKEFSIWWDSNKTLGEFNNRLNLDFESISERNSKSSKHIFYYAARKKYNELKLDDKYNIDRAILFYLMRELSFSSMFRFNSSGEFNVPYGGFAYNSKSFLNKLVLLKELSKHNISIEVSDFVSVIEKHKNDKDALIFLDPPYDSVFKDYNSNSFGKKDQIRLRDSLMNSKAKILMIINETKFIRDLYKDNFNISSYDKKYSVNFKNRNNQKVKHLVITNY